MRTSILATTALSLFTPALHATTNPAIFADFAANSPWSVIGSESPLTPLGDATTADGKLVLGETGLATLSGYTQPKGPFSVEARFLINQYGPQSSRFISDIASTATWSSTTSQGFVMRVGGGYQYPVLPSNAYESSTGYSRSQDYFDNTARASISRCLGEFSIATGGSSWKEVYTDVCIDRGRWVHMVAVYDGDDMRLFVDGMDATDGWRVVAPDATPALDATALFHIGASTTSSYDSRHAFGKIDFVRIHDSAMSSRSIRESFKKLAPENPEATCGRLPAIVTPQSGKWNDGRSRVCVRMMPTPGCVDSDAPKAWKKGDRVHVRISRGMDDANPIEVEMTDSVETFDSLLEEGQSFAAGEVLLAAALDSAVETPVAGRAMATTASLNFGASRPIVVGASVGVRRNVERKLSIRWVDGEMVVPGTQRPSLLGLDGRTLGWTARKIETGWALAPNTSDRGVFIVRASNLSQAVLVP